MSSLTMFLYKKIIGRLYEKLNINT
jgi:hypothetical protein